MLLPLTILLHSNSAFRFQRRQANFCMSLATQLILDGIKKNDSSENVLLSPLSINMMLNMVASGSGGQTLEQLLEFLGSKNINDLNDKSSVMMSLLVSETLATSSCEEAETLNPPPSPPKPVALFDFGNRTYWPWESPASMYSSMELRKKKPQAPLFSMANALWIDNQFSLMPSFKEIAENIYKAHVKNFDFHTQNGQIKQDVNSWVEKETKGLIKNLLSPNVRLGPPLCLANALYFKGAWEHPFYTSMTQDKNFDLLNGETTKVPFMISRNVYRFFASYDDYKVLKLSYQRGQCSKKDFSIYFFLPHRRDGLKDMMEKFNSNVTMLQPKRFRLRKVELSHVWIPKQKISYYINAKPLIENKGLTLPFNPMGADFRNMVNHSNVFIDSMLHKSCIEVNEEGTEAAAVTFSSVPGCAGPRREPPPPLPDFKAVHPFMFMIVEEFSKAVIFTGAVLNPSSCS